MILFSGRRRLMVQHRVLNECDRDVHVRLLLLVHRPDRSTLAAPAMLLLETASDDGHQGAVVGKRMEVLGLAPLAFGVLSDTSGEVGDALQGLLGAQQALSKGLKVQPEVSPAVLAGPSLFALGFVARGLARLGGCQRWRNGRHRASAISRAKSVDNRACAAAQ